MEKPDLNVAYSFIPNGEDSAFAKSLEPDSFELDPATQVFTREQRRWIYAVLELGLGDEIGKKQLRKYLADEIFRCSQQKIGAVTAYLSGKLAKKAELNRTEVWEDIELIRMRGRTGEVLERSEEEEIRPIELVREAPPANDPDYDNPAKEKGWREPYREMVEGAWGRNKPLRGKRMLILESPQLHEWNMLEQMGAEEANLTIVEREKDSFEKLKSLLPKASIHNYNLNEYLRSLIVNVDEFGKCGNRTEDCNFRLVAKGHPGLRKLLPDRTFSIKVRFPVQAQLRGSTPESFDLVSVDSKCQFPTDRGTLKLLFDLGLLKPEALLFSNFVAQRESSNSQRDYDESFVKRLFSGFEADEGVNLDSELRDRRSSAITHDIRSMACGSGQLFELLAKMGLRSGLDVHDFLAAMIKFNRKTDQVSSTLSNFDDFETALAFVTSSSDEMAMMLKNQPIQMLVKQSVVDAQILKKFMWLTKGVAFKKLGDNRLKKVFYRCGYKDEAFPAVLCRMVFALTDSATSGSYGILSHKSYSYHVKTLMHSDFLRLKDVFRITGLSRKTVQDLERVALGELTLSKKDRVRLKKATLPSLSPYLKYFFLDDIEGLVRRVGV